ncbi:hypothetical protein AURDEDRAFT_173350 [Auricularia subglabra TFB-10046 SS5]|nr:hypothetical protein AURDEDRAFT_173350 [Auricularia subglabra TFB-10046 SS5]
MGKRKQREADEEEEFQVEYIIEARLEDEQSRNWEYFVKWWGFPDSENSCIPASNLVGCERLLRSFWGQFGEHETWEYPEQAKSSKAWIEREKKYFARNVKKKILSPKKLRSDVRRSLDSTPRRG